MLHEFLSANRSELISRCDKKVAARRSSPLGTHHGVQHGIPAFLDQLITTLRSEQFSNGMPPLSRSPGAGQTAGKPMSSEMGDSATLHGRELLRQGFTIDQLVHDYGDACQAISDLAFEQRAAIEVDEFRTLNRCLDDAIAVAAVEFNYQRDQRGSSCNDRLGFFAHELRNHLNTATLAVSAIKAGSVGLAGATGAVLDRSLVGLRNLIDRTLAEVRLEASSVVPHEMFSLADFITEIKHSATLEARLHEAQLTVAPVDRALAVSGDRDLLMSAVGNLLQNAFKFTAHKSEVSLSAYSHGDRILIAVSDHCGGLPVGCAQTIFTPFVQGGMDTSGLGLGLSIARQSIDANGGTLSVVDAPGTGCTFTIDLPRHSREEYSQLLQ